MRLRTMMSLSLALLLTAAAGKCASAAAAGKAAGGSSSMGAKGAKAARASAGKGGVRKAGKRGRRREKGQKAPTADRITEIQQALTKEGAYSGTASGKWDDSTVEAMKKFQAGHGLNPSGRLDALTLQKLGLGSQTAGVAAPLPPVSSSLGKETPTQTAKRD